MAIPERVVTQRSQDIPVVDSVAIPATQVTVASLVVDSVVTQATVVFRDILEQVDIPVNQATVATQDLDSVALAEQRLVVSVAIQDILVSVG